MEPHFQRVNSVITFSTNPKPHQRTRSRGKRSGFKTILCLLEQINKFMAEHSPQDSTAYIALGSSTPELYLVTQSGAYDFELGDKLSDFAAPYIARGLLGGASLIPASTPDQLAAYFDLSKVIRIERVH